MSGGFPIGISVCRGNDAGINLAASTGTSIPWTLVNTKGAWTQLVAATPSDTSFVVIEATFDTVNNAIVPQIAFDIGIGAGGSEVAIAPNLYIAPPFEASCDFAVAIPLQINAGTRIAARAQSDGVTITSVKVKVSLYDASYIGVDAAGVDALNITLASTSPPNIPPSASANTWGAWTQIIAATARDYMGLFASYNAPARGAFVLQIGVGAGGQEQAIIPSHIAQFTNVQLSFGGQVIPFIPIEVPAGTRIAARCQTSGAASSGPNLSVHGVYQ